ncbi:hypothetical protein ERX35_011115 [Macrococcus equipercicus]|uniref:Colicin E3-like ribonuclease domain-containing protein n=1 Tax=Macrococcus equipercicus TaxID=69967 RepID=A0ABQ6R652_9STAP|nr:hypothetical protein ERX35_011115 [Macrococcus equipercicus]
MNNIYSHRNCPTKCRRFSIKTSGSGSKKRYYTWDKAHNEIEVYDKKGKHLGAMDSVTGKMIKKAVKGRKLW